MWRLVVAGDSGGNPHLQSLNNFVGRQYWEFDPTAGTAEERAQVDDLRVAYTKNRHAQRQPSDELLRLQAAERIKGAAVRISKDPSVLGAPGPVALSQVEHQIRGGMKYYSCLQQVDGHWAGDYGGPMFLMPGLVIALYTTGCLDRIFGDHGKVEVIRHLRNHQNEDGGFGVHIEGHSTMIGTALK